MCPPVSLSVSLSAPIWVCPAFPPLGGLACLHPVPWLAQSLRPPGGSTYRLFRWGGCRRPVRECPCQPAPSRLRPRPPITLLRQTRSQPPNLLLPQTKDSGSPATFSLRTQGPCPPAPSILSSGQTDRLWGINRDFSAVTTACCCGPWGWGCEDRDPPCVQTQRGHTDGLEDSTCKNTHRQQQPHAPPTYPEHSPPHWVRLLLAP